MLGQDHQLSIQALKNLANVKVAMSEFEDATNIYDQVLATESRILGTEHPVFYESLQQRAKILGEMGNIPDALILLERIIQFKEERAARTSFSGVDLGGKK